jgi:hypothetical protein
MKAHLCEDAANKAIRTWTREKMFAAKTTAPNPVVVFGGEVKRLQK